MGNETDPGIAGITVHEKGWNMKRRLACAALGLALLLTACGSQTEQVTDYGGKKTAASEEGGQSETGTSGEGNEGTTSEASASDPGYAALPTPQQDGKPIFEDTFQLKNKYPVEISIQTLRRDQDHYHSSQLKLAEMNPEQEKTVVQNIFGDTAKELHRDLSVEQGDSELLIEECNMFSGSNEINASGQPIVIPGWMDDEDASYHTYEGIYNNAEYQLVIGTYNKYGRGFILHPKNPGDAIGEAACDRLYQMDYHLNGDNYEMLNKKLVFQEMSDRPNRTVGSDEAIMSEAQKFAKDKLLMDVDKGDLKLTMGDDVGDPVKTELLFIPQADEKLNTLDGAVRDGYVVSYDMGHADHDFSTLNEGIFHVTDQGVIGCIVVQYYETEELLADDVQLLPFDKLMDAFERGLKENLSTEKINGSKLTITSTRLVYYPVYTEEKPDEFTLVPAWSFPLESNGTIGLAYVNAIDGSWLTAYYRN